MRATCDSSVTAQKLDLISQEQPDIALIDIGLPVLDGYAVARAVCTQMPGRAIRLVAMTGYGNPEDVQAGLRAGFDTYLVKPVDPVTLQDLIANAGANASI